MSKHTHDWKLVDSYDSWKRERPKSSLPKGQWVTTGGLFGGAFWSGPSVSEINADISRMVVETINRSDEPHYTSETWVCSCGKRKINSRTAPSLMKMLSPKKDTDA